MPRSSLWILLGLQVLAFWPVGLWLGRRLGDGSEEALGLAALALAAWLILRKARGPRTGSPSSWYDLRIPLGLTLVYGLGAPWLPPLLRAALALGALGSTLCLGLTGHPPDLPLWSLGALALPILPSLQFYLGYPMRVFSGELARGFLGGLGLLVQRQGSCLLFRDSLVLVDAPCSGVRGLWVALVLTSVLAGLGGLSRRSFLGLALLGAGASLVANGLRAASVFLLELGWHEAPSWAHESVGLMLFGLVVLTLVVAARWLSGPIPASLQTPEVALPQKTSGGITGILAVSLLAALVPAWTRPSQSFPGRIEVLPWGSGELVRYRLRGATRQFHPAADCYRGLGYRVEPQRAHRDQAGRIWGHLEVTAPDESRLQVFELVISDAGGSYPDPTAWYWPARMGTDPGPWWGLRWASPSRELPPGDLPTGYDEEHGKP